MYVHVRGFLRAVVHDMFWHDRNEDMLPVGESRECTQQYAARRFTMYMHTYSLKRAAVNS